MNTSKPRNITIHDVGISRTDSSKLKKINPKDLSKSIRSDYGIDPEEESETYDSYVDQIIKTVGQDMADEMFEQAKDILYRKALDIQVEDSNSKSQIKEHTTKADDVSVGNMNVDIKKVPGPRRKK